MRLLYHSCSALEVEAEYLHTLCQYRINDVSITSSTADLAVYSLWGRRGCRGQQVGHSEMPPKVGGQLRWPELKFVLEPQQA